MPRLNFKNNSFTFLAEALTDVQVSFAVVDASALPAVPFRVTLLDGVSKSDAVVEIIEVGAKDTGTNVLSSVLRGREGTVAVAHASGMRVENRLTADAHGELADSANLTTHTGTETAGVHGSASAATANKLIHRDAAGRAKVVAPSAEDDIALKSNVTTVQANLTAHSRNTFAFLSSVEGTLVNNKQIKVTFNGTATRPFMAIAKFIGRSISPTSTGRMAVIFKAFSFFLDSSGIVTELSNNILHTLGFVEAEVNIVNATSNQFDLIIKSPASIAFDMPYWELKVELIAATDVSFVSLTIEDIP